MKRSGAGPTRQQAGKTARQIQSDHDNYHSRQQLPVFGDRLKTLFEHHQRERAEYRPDQGTHASQNHHHQHRTGQMPTEHFRIDDTELRGRQEPCETRQRTGYDKADPLLAKPVETKFAHARFIDSDANNYLP